MNREDVREYIEKKVMNKDLTVNEDFVINLLEDLIGSLPHDYSLDNFIDLVNKADKRFDQPENGN